MSLPVVLFDELSQAGDTFVSKKVDNKKKKKLKKVEEKILGWGMMFLFPKMILLIMS